MFITVRLLIVNYINHAEKVTWEYNNNAKATVSKQSSINFLNSRNKLIILKPHMNKYTNLNLCMNNDTML